MQYDQQSEANKAKLLAMVKQHGNKECADCTSRSVKWACFNHGTFVCIKCSGIHRSLGRHISKVKSLTLDKWTTEEMAGMRGNLAANSEYLYNLPDGLSKPDENDDTGRRKWIERKYVKQEWVRRQDQPPGQGAMEKQGVQSTPSLPEVSSTSSIQSGLPQSQSLPSQPNLQPPLQQVLFSTPQQLHQNAPPPTLQYPAPGSIPGGLQQAAIPAASPYQLGQFATSSTLPGLQTTTQQQQSHQEMIQKIIEQQNQYMQQYQQYQQQTQQMQMQQQAPQQYQQQYYQTQHQAPQMQLIPAQQQYQQVPASIYQQFKI